MPAGYAIGSTEQYGNVLVAMRPFSPGEVVLTESPLLRTEGCDGEPFDALLSEHRRLDFRVPLADGSGRDQAVEFSNQALRWAAADERTRTKVLSMFSPCTLQHGHAYYVRAAKDYTAQLHAALEAHGTDRAFVHGPLGALATHPLEAIEKVLLVWACNCYMFGDGAAVFELGSLFTHRYLHGWLPGCAMHACLHACMRLNRLLGKGLHPCMSWSRQCPGLPVHPQVPGAWQPQGVSVRVCLLGRRLPRGDSLG